VGHEGRNQKLVEFIDFLCRTRQPAQPRVRN
jgi:hypothetical protein